MIMVIEIGQVVHDFAIIMIVAGAMAIPIRQGDGTSRQHAEPFPPSNQLGSN
jgi:hypothetical protein